MNRSIRIDDGEPHVTIDRNILGVFDLVPHFGIEHVRQKMRFDLAQNGRRCRRQLETSGGAMERFVRRENIRHYQQLLKRVTDEAERQGIFKLLAEERKMQKEAGDKIEED